LGSKPDFSCLDISGATAMLVTTLCLWLYDGYNFKLLVNNCACDFFQPAVDFLNVKNRSPTSRNSHSVLIINCLEAPIPCIHHRAMDLCNAKSITKKYYTQYEWSLLFLTLKSKALNCSTHVLNRKLLLVTITFKA